MIAASAAALIVPTALRAETPGQPFSWNGLVAMARRLAAQPFAPTPPHPDAQKVDYDALHAARFRDERTLWNERGDDVGIRFFPLSRTAPEPVTIHAVEGGLARPLAYDPAMFDAPAGNAVAALGRDAGFAGFRVMNRARDADWLSFLGASYFRAAGAERQYGLSARAVAINSSVGGEEFPRFTTFWLEYAGPARLIVHALLDGASITGAFRFVCSLDKDGVHQDVTAALFPRRAIRELGLMAMTSMFWYDQANAKYVATDWRPEIHDSDTLAIRSADGAAHARSLINPRVPNVSVFAEPSPRGFGLMQRDRNFDHYQDDGVFYHRRPSLWVTPAAPLGDGEVRLYEFPTDSEYTDNVVAYWTPTAPAAPGRRIDAAYRLDWTSGEPAAAVARLANIWRGRGDGENVERLLFDFSSVPEGSKPDLICQIDGGTVVKQAVYPVIGQPGLYRAVIDLRAQGPAVGIRAQLRRSGAAISEMAHYRIDA